MWSRRLALGFAGSMLAANLVMQYALITRDFSVSYVASTGSRSTPAPTCSGWGRRCRWC